MNIQEVIIETLGELLETDPVVIKSWDPAVDLTSQGLDSLATVELIDRLENATGAQIDPAHDAASLRSITKLAALLTGKLGE
jgi:acyl carrier protein